MNYNEFNVIKTKILHNDEVLEGNLQDLKTKHTTVWVDLSEPRQEELESIVGHIGIGREDIEELLHTNQRPILQDLGEFTAVVFHVPEIEGQEAVVKPSLLFASKEQKDFITIHPGSSSAIEKISSHPQKRLAELFRKGSTALLFAVLDEMVAASFESIDYFSDEINKLEEQVFKPKLSSQVLKRVFSIKKALINFQRTLSADREVISAIEKAYGEFLDKRLLSNFRLLYSDLTQLIELATTYRDITISVVEVHLSAISNNLNVVMKKLTAWAAIILVPSLIAGIYGMNFAHLPFARDPAGFWYMIGAMAVSILLLYSYFKYHDWI